MGWRDASSMLLDARAEEIPVTTIGPHLPVLPTEVLELLDPQPGSIIVDGTLGPGGHTELLLGKVGETGCVIGIDRDPAALAHARKRLARFGAAFIPVLGNHEQLRELLAGEQHFAVNGILLDLGLSSLQLDDPERGFSFMHDGPLDMRMNPASGVTAAELLEQESAEWLADILHRFGEERYAAKIVRAIKREQALEPITTTGQLADLVERTIGPRARKYKIHPATRSFQALRIAVNGEVEGLRRLVADAVSILRRGGRLAVISYHSLEDREIKHTLRGLASRCTCPPRMPVCGCGKENLVRVLTGKPVSPQQEEIDQNPRSRSAHLRVAERL
jgi:16S rRNA (cytosine1402-N4)-methyltransferase